jgi:hypothetical protein
MLAKARPATYAARMRTLVVLLAATFLSGCMSTVLAEPAIHASPYLAVYQLRGKTKMESFDPMGAVQNNAYQNMRAFGQDRFREDVGIRADIGDGFGGIRVDYYQLDMDTSRNGELTSDWGDLLDTDKVSLYANMDELRIGYVEPFADFRTEYRDEELRFQFAVGGVFTYRQMTLKARDETFTRAQNFELAGDTIGGAVRARISWKAFSLDLDYAGAPAFLVLSGDIEGLSQDIEARLSYRLPQRDISFFAGLRYTEFSGKGMAGSFQYDSDMVIDGMQFGVKVTF